MLEKAVVALEGYLTMNWHQKANGDGKAREKKIKTNKMGSECVHAKEEQEIEKESAETSPALSKIGKCKPPVEDMNQTPQRQKSKKNHSFSRKKNKNT